jgi:hypothetical protein
MPNPMAGRLDFESVQAETWWLRSHVSSEEDPMPESQWKPRGVAGQPRGWLSGHPSPLPLYKDPRGRIHTHHTLFVVLHL